QIDSDWVGFYSLTQVPERPWFAHVVFGPSGHDPLKSSFPVADRSDRIFDIEPDLAPTKVVSVPPQGQIAPVQPLHRPHAGVLRGPIGILLPFKRNPARESLWRFRVIDSDAHDIEPNASTTHPTAVPRSHCNSLVRVWACPGDFTHLSPSKKCGPPADVQSFSAHSTRAFTSSSITRQERGKPALWKPA